MLTVQLIRNDDAFRGTSQILTRGITRGNVEIDVTSHVRSGTNTFRIDVTDGELSKSLTFVVTGITINLTSTFNDSNSIWFRG